MNSNIVPTLALIIALALFFAYVNPTWNGPIAATKAALASDDTALAAATSYTSEQSQLTAARNAIDTANIARLETFLPDSIDNVGLILDLDALAAHSGLALSNIDVVNSSSAGAQADGSASAAALPSAGTSPVGSIDLTLSAIGTWSALQNFLSGVEKSERILDVRDLTVKGSDTGVYNYQMIVRLYWLR